MLTKAITYENLDGEKVTGTYYFNLNKAEVAKLQMLTKEGEALSDYLKRVLEEQNARVIVETVELFITKSVGVRQGDRFIKSDDITAAFLETGAYAEMFMELATDAKKCAEFIIGVLPIELGKQVVQTDDYKVVMSKIETVEIPEQSSTGVVLEKKLIESDPSPVIERKITDYTQAELAAMSPEDFMRLLGK